jgi:hypothetical protein
MPGTYPNYTANTQDISHDLPGRIDIANAADYNDHDAQIIAHQAILINHEARITSTVPDGVYLFDGTTAGTVSSMTIESGVIKAITVR